MLQLIRLPNLKGYRDRHGKTRYYVRLKGKKDIPVAGEPASLEWLNNYRAAVASLEKTEPSSTRGAAKSPEGTANALLVEFYGSDHWQHSLKEITQRTYRRIYEKWREEWGSKLIRDLTKRDAQLMVDAIPLPQARRSFLKRMQALLDFAVERDYREDNPFRLVKLARIQSEGFVAWSDKDIEAFTKAHPPGSMPRRALALLLYTTQRRSDIHLMGRHNEVAEGKAIKVVQVKGRKGKPPVELILPIHPALKAELDLAPKDGPAYVTNAYGQPFSTEGFTKWFVRQAELAGLSGRSPHGLRKAGARMLAEAGAGANQIAAMTGHRTLSEVERYTRSADQKRLAEGAMSNLISGGV